MALLLVVLSTLALLSLLDTPRAGPALAFGLLAALATWAHLFAALVLVAQVLAALRHPGLRRALGWLATGAALGGAGSAAIITIAMRGDGGQVAWIGPLSWGQVASTFVHLAGGVRLLLLPAAAGAVVTLVMVQRGPRGFGAFFSLAWALVPLALAAVVSTVKPLYVPHYFLVTLPGFLLLTAAGLGALPNRRLVSAAIGLAIALSLHQVVIDRNALPIRQPLDRVAARILELARPGDALVVSHPALSLSLDRELARLGHAAGPTRVEPLAGELASSGAATLAPLDGRLAGRPGVIFVLYAEQAVSARARATFQARARVTDDENLGGVRLLRLEPSAGR